MIKGLPVFCITPGDGLSALHVLTAELPFTEKSAFKKEFSLTLKLTEDSNSGHRFGKQDI